jgi:hypothetical protein
MDQPPVIARGISPWLWLCSMGAFGILCIVLGVRNGELGLAISGAGFLVLSAFAFLAAPPFNANLSEFLRPKVPADPRIAYLAGIGGALNLIGIAMTWLG